MKAIKCVWVGFLFLTVLSVSAWAQPYRATKIIGEPIAISICDPDVVSWPFTIENLLSSVGISNLMVVRSYWYSTCGEFKMSLLFRADLDSSVTSFVVLLPDSLITQVLGTNTEVAMQVVPAFMEGYSYQAPIGLVANVVSYQGEGGSYRALSIRKDGGEAFVASGTATISFYVNGGVLAMGDPVGSGGPTGGSGM